MQGIGLNFCACPVYILKYGEKPVDEIIPQHHLAKETGQIWCLCQ